MSVRDDIRHALYDAIGWQQGLEDAWPEGSPERERAREQVRRYRQILKRRYGINETPEEALAKEGQPISLLEALKRAALT